MRNETPVGLATILGILPAVGAGALMVALLVMNGGDVEDASTKTLAIIAAVSLVGTAALRQWRAIRHEQAAGVALPPPAAPPQELPTPGELGPDEELEPTS